MKLRDAFVLDEARFSEYEQSCFIRYLNAVRDGRGKWVRLSVLLINADHHFRGEFPSNQYNGPCNIWHRLNDNKLLCVIHGPNDTYVELEADHPDLVDYYIAGDTNE